jgi:5,10-methylenetetrahydrofolate reductase
MAKTLELIFETAAGKAVTLSVEEPREDVTAQELSAGMQAIITQNVFEVEGSAFALAKGARIIERNVVEYEL